jgi:hypothetical protein
MHAWHYPTRRGYRTLRGRLLPYEVQQNACGPRCPRAHRKSRRAASSAHRSGINGEEATTSMVTAFSILRTIGNMQEPIVI